MEKYLGSRSKELECLKGVGGPLLQDEPQGLAK